MSDKFRLVFELPVPPARVHAAWLSSREHASTTGGAARVEPRVGGRHSVFDGYAFGFTLALDADRSLVQSWRTTEFPADAPDPIVEVTFTATTKGTKVTLLHRDIPAGQGAKYRQGWDDFYVTPMSRYFAEEAARSPRPKNARGTPKKPPAAAKTTRIAARKRSRVT